MSSRYRVTTKTIQWKEEGDQVTCRPAIAGLVVGAIICLVLGPGLTATWFFKLPLLMEILDSGLANAVFVGFVAAGWFGSIRALFYERRLVFDFGTRTISFYRGDFRSQSYRLSMDQVAGYETDEVTRYYTGDNHYKRPYQVYFIQLLTADSQPPIRLFESCSRPQVELFGKLLAERGISLTAHN